MIFDDKAFEELSDDLKAKVRACESPEDILKLAQAEGITLSDEQLAGLEGGSDWGGSCFMVCKQN